MGVSMVSNLMGFPNHKPQTTIFWLWDFFKKITESENGGLDPPFKRNLFSSWRDPRFKIGNFMLDLNLLPDSTAWPEWPDCRLSLVPYAGGRAGVCDHTWQVTGVRRWLVQVQISSKFKVEYVSSAECSGENVDDNLMEQSTDRSQACR